ncbi:hypothetical protein [Mangrovicoccus sp. HB161399]|uniref:hypothetical protein n=1 Tax=Mangrovicoccus sp. HB161399 TaxID=2720392 RepID=UPI001553B395|nr:hypothetical protein [Mangrovicoccus sp. HB161399]
MSLTSMLKSAAKSYARSKGHSHGPARPGSYRAGARRSPKSAAAEQAVREVGKFLRKSR